MSVWYYQQDDCLGGPISFDGLARLIVDDELSESDVVCRADEVGWVPIASIVGLKRKCEVLSGQRTYVPPTAAEIAESGVYPVSREEIRRRAARATARPRRKPKPAPRWSAGSIKLRDALMWCVVALGGIAATVMLYDEFVIGARDQPTYERSD